MRVVGRGVADPMALGERLANIVSDGISPRVVPDIDVVPWRGTHVVVARVALGPSRPYHVVRDGEDSGVYVRLGSSNRAADEHLRGELARTVRPGTFDETPLVHLDSEAVDFRVASESFARVRAVDPRALESLGVFASVEGRHVPTVGGILLFGSARAAEFPDSWLQAGRFKGLSRTHIIDTADMRAALPSLVDEGLGFVMRNTALRQEVAGSRRTETWEYPLAAVREALVNAILHADYSQTGAPLRMSGSDSA